MTARARAAGPRRLTSACRDDRGSVTVQNMIWMATLLAASGFAIDTANAFRTKAMLQAAADAAALAAVIDLPDEAKARRTARDFAALNLPPAAHGDVLRVTDVQVGAWLDGRFRAGLAPADAVRVEVGRTEGRGNALPTLLLKLVGKVDFQIEADAVARRGADGSSAQEPCVAGGFAADGEATLGSSNLAPEGWCLHGQQVVEIGGENVFETGSVLTLEDEREFYEGWGNAGVDDARFEQSLSVSLPRMTAAVDAAIRDDLSALPGFVRRGPYLAERLPRRPLRGTLYVVSGPAEIAPNAVLSGVAIVADGPITVGAGAVMEDVVLVSGAGVDVGAGATLGPESVCDDGAVSVYIFAKDDVDLGPSPRLRGVQAAAGGDLRVGDSAGPALGVYGEAMGNVEIGSRLDFEGCPDPLDSHWPETTWAPLTKLTVATALTR